MSGNTPISDYTPISGTYNNYVWLCMYMCLYVYMYACIDVSMCVCMFVCIYVNICVYVHMYRCIYVCMYVYVYICVYVCMYICVYICVNVYMHARHRGLFYNPIRDVTADVDDPQASGGRPRTDPVLTDGSFPHCGFFKIWLVHMQGKSRTYTLDQTYENSTTNKSCPKCTDFNAGPFFPRFCMFFEQSKTNTKSRILECLWSGQKCSTKITKHLQIC
jgi:hypothetical protein